jgi:Protein of unknown function (DUF3153)
MPRQLISLFLRWRIMLVSLVAVFALSGCVKYEVGINVESPTHGAIVQHLKFDERLSSLTSSAAQAWITNIEERTRKLGGKVRRFSNKEVTVTIPFTTSEDLKRKFNTFFDPAAKSRYLNVRKLDLPAIASKLSVQSGNFLLLERRHFVYDLDLRSLGVTAPDGDVIVNPSSLIDLEFRMSAPWGVHNVVRKNTPPTRRDGKDFIWMLQPGQLNHLEATFWMPSPLGFGTLVVIAIVGIGVFIKNAQSAPTVAESVSRS